MKLINIPPRDFLKAEIRNGYEITEHMKKVWAVQLDMVQELQRICQKYNLSMWADGGTMLGAIRHGGYIPWDDDIDIAMPRADYDKLQEVAPKELPAPFFFQTIHTDPGYTHRHAQIRNSTTCVRGEKQTSYSFNCGIFIDIFPFDAMPSNPRGFKRHYNKVSSLKRRIRFTQKCLSHFPKGVYMFCRDHIPAFSDERLFCKFENLLRSITPCRASIWVNIACNHRSPLQQTFCYKETFWVDFEYIKLPVPKEYDTLLTIQYGDYMTPVKAPPTHGSMVFDTDRSYKEVLKEW